MALQDLGSQFPTFSRAAAVVRREVSSHYVGVWLLATTVFAVLHTAITVGASWWRYQADVAAHDAVVAAIDRYNAVAETLDDPLTMTWPQIGAPALDLDVGAAVGQVVAATAGFGLLLAIALVLVAHRRTVAGYVAALSTGLSVALMAGVLARISPMIPVRSTGDLAPLNLDVYPPALRQLRVDLDAVTPVQDTATWWNYAIAAVVALLALVTVEAARRVGGTYPDAGDHTEPVLVDLAAVVAVLVPTVVILGPDVMDQLPSWSEPTLLLAMTLLVAVLAARAAAASGVGTAVALTVGFVLVHVLLYAAFHRAGGADGGWGVGSGGVQRYASTLSVAVLALSPLAGRLAAAAWARLPRHREPVTPAITA